jgi:hypothetical protein
MSQATAFWIVTALILPLSQVSTLGPTYAAYTVCKVCVGTTTAQVVVLVRQQRSGSLVIHACTGPPQLGLHRGTRMCMVSWWEPPPPPPLVALGCRNGVLLAVLLGRGAYSVLSALERPCFIGYAVLCCAVPHFAAASQYCLRHPCCVCRCCCAMLCPMLCCVDA